MNNNEQYPVTQCMTNAEWQRIPLRRTTDGLIYDETIEVGPELREIAMNVLRRLAPLKNDKKV